MIKLQKLRVEEFRGIRELELSLDGKNFGICGPNGTGKSGIVDAIEFALTGDITRLSGYGTQGVSVKSHAPHVDSRKSPEKAKVQLSATIAATAEPIIVDRLVSAPDEPAVKPSTAKTGAVLADLATHPEFALSRREIIKYILTPPGQRSKDVQVLLRLEQLEKVRQSIQSVANSCVKECQQTGSAFAQARFELQQALGVSKLDAKNVLDAVNARRAILQLPALAELTPEGGFKAGLRASPASGTPAATIQKKTARADVLHITEESEKGESAQEKQYREQAISALTELKARPEGLRDLKQQILVTQGLDLVDGEACPLCDTAWDEAELRQHLQEKLAKAEEAQKILRKLKAALSPLVLTIEAREERLARIAGYFDALKPKIPCPALAADQAKLSTHREAIERIASEPGDLDAEIATLSKPRTLSKVSLAEISKLETRLEALPEPTKEEEARDYLTVAQDRYDRYRQKRKATEAAEKQQKVADRVLEHYNASNTTVLEGIYKAVEKDFTEYYRFINQEDEKEFEGQLKPSVGKLGFDVDFYGRGKFPPGAYHSEGHQDGMGLCLYLALMKHTLGDNFTFAVLDDVLMSIDAGHRRDVCRLLKLKFPKTQFIVTTHDPVWLQYMKTERFIESSVSFGSWEVATGPKVWRDEDVWTEINGELAKNAVSKAAGTLRRYLEYVATLLADRLGAEVPFHGNGQYDLGDLMPAVVRRWKALLTKASKAAASWGKKQAETSAFEATVKEKVARSQTEQWAINKALHYNEWATLQKNEMGAVVAAYKELLDTVRCPDCKTFVHVSPPRGEAEVVKCDCGTININLRPK